MNLFKLFYISAAVMFVVSAVYILYVMYNYRSAANEYESIKKITEKTTIEEKITVEKDEETTYLETETEQTTEALKLLNIDHNALKRINSDYIFYISACGDDISYPVVQCGSNDYYLYRTFYKKRNYSGCIFADCRDNINGRQIRLYGHSMKNGTMFRKLINYKNKDFFEKYPYFIIYENGNIIKYDIFSVYISQNDKVFALSDENSLSLIKQINNAAIYDTGITANENDKIVSLITCDISDTKKRVVVNAKKSTEQLN